jgi:hypothetical protein
MRKLALYVTTELKTSLATDAEFLGYTVLMSQLLPQITKNNNALV